MRARLLIAVVAATGCATAGKDDPALVDANVPVVDTAPAIDALIPVTLSQTSDTTIAAAQTLACGGAGYTRENRWYRVFRLPDFQITSPLHVTSVTFGIQEASANQSIELKLGIYAGTVGAATLDLAMISPLTAKTLNLATMTTNETVETAIDTMVPAGSNLIVEIFSADHNQTTTYFYAGATTGTETSPGYLMATNCAQPVPRAMKDIDVSAGSLVISVTGTHY